MPYAENTSVSSDKSRAEIERILARYGASSFAYATQPGQAAIMFEAEGRRIRFIIELPDRNDREFTHTPARKNRRSDAQIEAAYEQAVRQRWRALCLVVKAKLEAVEAGITEFEDEFMSHIVLPDGSSFGDWARPQIQHAYETNDMPALMPGANP